MIKERSKGMNYVYVIACGSKIAATVSENIAFEIGCSFILEELKYENLLKEFITNTHALIANKSYQEAISYFNQRSNNNYVAVRKVDITKEVAL
jgi:hypothetical protein